MCKKTILLFTLALALGMVPASVTVAANNLIGWWKFDGDTLDSSGLGNDGIPVGDPTFVAGIIGSNALDLDGDDYVTMDAVADDITSNNIALSAWVKTTDTRGLWFSCNTAGRGNVALFNIDGGLANMYDGSDSSYEGHSSTNVSDGAWHMLTYVREGDTGYIYVDGLLENTHTAGYSFSASDLWSIGQEWDGGGASDFLIGTVDDVRIYDHSMTEAQVLGLFNGIDPIFVKAENPDPADGAMYDDTWVSLGWSPGDTAASHDVYFSDSFDNVNDGVGDAFRGNVATTFFVAGFPGYPYPDGLVKGATYYWRIDEVEADGTTKHRGPVWSFWIPSLTAYAPYPPDGIKFVDPDVTLSWTAGFGAKLHTVYFGESFDDVANATGGASQATATYVPGALAKDTVYYWRVDEFEAPITHKGDVWSFTTLSEIPIADPNLIGWWKFDEGHGTTALDFSGHGNDGTLVNGPQWVDGFVGGALYFNSSSYVTMDPVADDIKSDDITLSGWIKTANTGTIWFSCNTASRGNVAMFSISNGQAAMYDGSDSAYEGRSTTLVNDNEWHLLTYVRSGPTGYIYVDGFLENTHAAGYSFSADDLWSIGQEWDAGGASNFLNGIVDDARIYNMAITQGQIAELMRGDPLLAWNPSPGNKSLAFLNLATPLTWSPGDSAAQHDVYFGADMAAVEAADASGTTGIYRGRQSLASFTPSEGLEWAGGPYYWRVDEINADGTISTGRLWTFTLADYLLVEDFESYNDIETAEPGSDLVYETWLDGFGIPTNGSTVGYTVAFQPTMETGTAHGGRQSAPLEYDNATAAFSEISRTLAPQNWTEHGVQVLSLWFYGNSTNLPGQLYIKVNGVKVLYDGPAGNLRIPGWQAWNIDLASSGLNLQNVTSMAIGIEGAGASGILLLDDIGLHRSASAPVNEWQITAGSDDAEEHVLDGGVMETLASSDLELGYEGAMAPAGLQTVGCRWAGVPIPRGATITEAWVQFSADDINNGYHVPDVSVIIAGELSANAATFEQIAGNISGRTATATQVVWDIPQWMIVHAKGPEERTPDISSIIQEIVNQPGWAGGAIVLTFRDNPAKPSQGTREAESFDGSATEAPLLHISYQ